MVGTPISQWEKSVPFRPANNIKSSDFHKFIPVQWKFMEGKARMEWLLSNEYQRMWIEERNAWEKGIYPQSIPVTVDFMKRNIGKLKNIRPPTKTQNKNSFRMKKFEGIGSKTETKRPPGDKALRKQKPIQDPAK